MLRVLLVNPHLSFDKRDPLTTGIVYMPVGLAYLAAECRRIAEVQVMDCFGEDPNRATNHGQFVELGLGSADIASRLVQTDPHVVVLYANQVANHESLLRLAKLVRDVLPEAVVIAAENTQAVTAYSLTTVKDQLVSGGVDVVVTGEPEFHVIDYLQNLVDDSLLDCRTSRLTLSRKGHIENLDDVDFPAWELFPLTNYWSLKFAHGPLSSDRYLPLLTSRGCPYPCKFCVVPTTNERRWRSRSARSVVDEIQRMESEFGVREYHVEDLNPTINNQRMREIAEEILQRGLNITWKIVAGTKIETIRDPDTLRLLARSGLSYLSMSPESGSERLLRIIGKPFDVLHALDLVTESRRLGVRTQACFVLGYPGETKEDQLASRKLARRLVWNGLDEVALFIASPLPGSAIFEDYVGQYSSLSELTFSPRWREDYHEVQGLRMRMYFEFLALKFIRRPWLFVRQLRNFFARRFETKMEMAPYRAFRYRRLARIAVVDNR